MATTPTISDEPEGGRVIEFRVPENWVPPKLRPSLPFNTSRPKEANSKKAKPASAQRQPAAKGETITQAALEELARLKARYKEARDALREQEDFITWNLMHGARVQDGERSARLAVVNRFPNGRTPGASFYRLLTR